MTFHNLRPMTKWKLFNATLYHLRITATKRCIVFFKLMTLIVDDGRTESHNIILAAILLSGFGIYPDPNDSYCFHQTKCGLE